MNAQELIDRAELHKLNDELSDSIHLWKKVIDQYPGTDQSAYAVEQLKKHPSSNESNGNNKKPTSKTGLIFAVFIAYLAFNVISTLGENTAHNASSSSKQLNKEPAPIIVSTTLMDAQGVTEADFTQENLKILESAMLSKMLKAGKNNISKHGYDEKNYNPVFTAQSSYLVVDGKKLAIIKVNADKIARFVSIYGFMGKEQVAVNCGRNSNHDIPIWSGKCAEEIKKSYGIHLLE